MDDGENTIIRRIKKWELESLVQVYQSAYKRMMKYAYKKGERIKNYLEWLYQGDPEGLLAADRKGEIVGFASIHSEWEDWRWGKTGELHELVVREEFQGKGIGKKLFNKAVAYAVKKGCKTLSLWVGEENWIARSWYQRLGFEEKGSWGEWVRMRKDLSSPEIEKINKNAGKDL